MPKKQYAEKAKEKIIENLHEYLERAPEQFERAEQYLTARPRATQQELERAGFSPLLKKAGYSPSILREYLGISPEQKRKRPTLEGTNNDSLLNALRQKTLTKLVDYRNQNADRFTSITDYIAAQHYQHNKSIRQLTKEIGIAFHTLGKIFKTYNLPVRPNAEAVKEMLSERWKDEDFRKRQAEATKEMLSERWKDEDFRKRNAEATKENWKDEDFRKRQAEAVKENWKDEDFRKRNAEAVRKAKSNYTDTNSGYRPDLDKKTASNAEANIERAISHSNRNYEIKLWHNNSNVKNHSSTMPVYFLTTSPRGSKVAYVLIPSPYKKPKRKKKN